MCSKIHCSKTECPQPGMWITLPQCLYSFSALFLKTNPRAKNLHEVQDAAVTILNKGGNTFSGDTSKTLVSKAFYVLANILFLHSTDVNQYESHTESQKRVQKNDSYLRNVFPSEVTAAGRVYTVTKQ